MSQQTEEISEEEQLFLEYKTKYLMVSCQEKLNCSFDGWYKQFRKQSIKSRMIPLNHTFIEYLKQDGLRLPPQIQSEMDHYYELDSDNDSDYDNVDTFKEKETEKEEHKATDNESCIDYTLLDDLFTKIREKIQVLKDEVVPKLNWSAPKDAKWINNQTLKCDNVTQILLLLKASQFVQHDLCHPFHGCFDYDSNHKPAFEYKLILRKYSNLYPNREFRCFVYNRQLIAIAQRNDDDVFDELQSEKTRNKIRDCIQTFFKLYVENVFVSDKFVMDVYLDKEFKVYIIDFNPFYEFTDCGTVLSWMDICTLIEKKQGNDEEDSKQPSQSQIVFGYVDSNETAKIKFNSNSQYRYPIDAVDLTNEKEINAFVESCNN